MFKIKESNDELIGRIPASFQDIRRGTVRFDAIVDFGSTITPFTKLLKVAFSK